MILTQAQPNGGYLEITMKKKQTNKSYALKTTLQSKIHNTYILSDQQSLFKKC